MTPIDPDIRQKVFDLYKSGKSGAEIGRELGMDRSKANYIIRLKYGNRPKPPPYIKTRICATCGKADSVRGDVKSKRCWPCSKKVTPETNRRNHVHTWTTANCRQCGIIFKIRKCNLESRRRSAMRVGGKYDPNFVPFCHRRCYDDWQRGEEKPRREFQ